MRLTVAYSWYFNRRYGGVGHVWQGSYKSALIDKGSYFFFLTGIREKLDEGVFGKEDFIRQGKERFRLGSLRPRGRPEREKNRVDLI